MTIKKQKEERQREILNLINKSEINTQEDLQAYLIEKGYKFTQATISRDIKELELVKSSQGGYKRAQTGGKNSTLKVLKHIIISVKTAKNLVVVKTHSGMGSAAGAAIDSFDFDGVVGTLAGDDTLLIILLDDLKASEIEEKINDLIL